MRIFKKKKKKSVFISEGQPPEVNELGIKSEYNNNLFTKIILLVFALLGFTLCVLDIRDDGMLLKLSFGETEFNYAGSLIGVVVMIISMIVMLFHNRSSSEKVKSLFFILSHFMIAGYCHVQIIILNQEKI